MASISDKKLFDAYADKAMALNALSLYNEMLDLADELADFTKFKQELVRRRKELSKRFSVPSAETNGE